MRGRWPGRDRRRQRRSRHDQSAGPRARSPRGGRLRGRERRGHPRRQARPLRIGAAPVHAARISYASELGWESDRAAWAEPWQAPGPPAPALGSEPFGYRALDALRMEKGYRYFGTDLTMLDTPLEAGLGTFVRFGKGPFIGRDALVAACDAEPGGPSRRLRTVLIGGTGYLPVYGGEAVRRAGEVVGRLRSVAFGPTVERTIGYVYLPAGVVRSRPGGGRLRRARPHRRRSRRARGRRATGSACDRRRERNRPDARHRPRWPTAMVRQVEPSRMSRLGGRPPGVNSPVTIRRATPGPSKSSLEVGRLELPCARAQRSSARRRSRSRSRKCAPEWPN
jgi:hypothetical protein